MHIFTLEHSKVAYRADLALYCITVSGFGSFPAGGVPA